MSILELFVSKNEQQSNAREIGKITSSDNMPGILIGILNSMGMVNPKNFASSTSKAVVITKKGKSYTLTLNMYTPPIRVKWTGLLTKNKLAEILEKIAAEQKKIGYINSVKLSNGTEMFQLALG